ncbi:MAG: leucine-rich repeat domain-containing protein [Ruminococcaceae bacterium]|nr:leucine-rich repeat domain-containing protein [Oscillospiraceae bacterium]
MFKRFVGMKELADRTRKRFCMKMTKMKEKKWQLLRVRTRDEVLDLSDKDFLTVGKGAFRAQRSLEELILPPSVSVVKRCAFVGCRHLKQVEFRAERPFGLSTSVFSGCDRLHEIVNSEMLSQVGDRAFLRCRTLEQIRFGNDLKRIGAEAFRSCRALKEVEIPSCVSQIGKDAFADCTELCRLSVGEGIEVLGEGAFRGCISLASIELPVTLREISARAFLGCSALREVSLPCGVEKIRRRAFYGCSRLERVRLELGVARIGAGAFAHARELREVYLPHTVKRLGFGAFGLGKRADGEKIRLFVDNEYMIRRMKWQLLLCGSRSCVELVMNGETLADRKRARHRESL